MTKSTPFILILIALIISACNIKPTASESETVVLNTPVPATSVPVAPSLPEPTGQQVTDERIGFTFNYPNDWFIGSLPAGDGVAYAYTMQSIEPGIGGGGFPEGESKIDLYVNASETFTSLDTVLQRLQEQASQQENHRIAVTDFFTLDNGIDALLIRGESMWGEYESIHMLINGYHISIGNIGEKRFMWDVANSIRLI